MSSRGSRRTAEPELPGHWSEVDWTRYERDLIVARRRLRFVDIGQGPVVLLVHGLGMSWQCWLENILAIARDHRVIAVDLPGFGDSEPAVAVHGIAAYSDTLAELADLLGVRSATVVGHSMGGMVAQRLAIDHAALVSGLLLVCPGDPTLGRARKAVLVVAFRALHGLLRRRAITAAIVRSPRLQRAVLSGFVVDRTCITPALAVQLSRASGRPATSQAWSPRGATPPSTRCTRSAARRLWCGAARTAWCPPRAVPCWPNASRMLSWSCGRGWVTHR